MTHKFLVELPDGRMIRKAISEMRPSECLVFKGPDAWKDFEEMQKAFCHAEAYLDGEQVDAISADVRLSLVRVLERPARVENGLVAGTELKGRVEIRFHKA